MTLKNISIFFKTYQQGTCSKQNNKKKMFKIRKNKTSSPCSMGFKTYWNKVKNILTKEERDKMPNPSSLLKLKDLLGIVRPK